jgi:hypothetical protein
MNSPARVNPFEIALWILSAALLVAGVAGALWASGVMNGGFSCSGADCSPPSDYALAQTFYMMAPPMVTAGLIAAVLSVALRAGLVGLALRTAAPAAPVEASDGVPGVGAPLENGAASMTDPRYSVEGAAARLDPDSFPPPQFRQGRRAPDHSAFQRPTAE